MNRIFDLENPVWSFFGKVGDAMLLSLLWFVFSIPVVTSGAATTAVYYCSMRNVREEETHVTKSFLHSFKQNLKQGSIIGVLSLLCGGIIGFNIWFYITMSDGTLGDNGLWRWMLIAMLFFLWVYLFVQLWIYAVLARFENTTKQIFRFALAIGIRKIGWSFLMLFVAGMYILLGFRYMPLFLIFTPGMVALLNSYPINHCFEPFVEGIEEKELSEKEE